MRLQKTDLVWQSGSTAFGYYDSESIFQTDCVKVGKLFFAKVGGTSVGIQMNIQQIYTNFESAILKYTALVNTYKIKDTMGDVFGQKVTTDLTSASVMPSYNFVAKISQLYGQQSVFLATPHIPVHSASISIKANQQKYDLKQLIGYSSSKIEIFKVHHYKPAIVNQFFDSYNGIGSSADYNFTQFGMFGSYSYMLSPLYADVLKMQQIQLNQQIRRSAYKFDLYDGELRIYPTPVEDTTLWIQYIERQAKTTQTIVQDTINNISNYPINDIIPYGKINMPGRQWIWNYTVALNKQTLGLIRSKFGSVPYTQGELQMDGETLRTQGKTQQSELIQQLKQILQESSMYNSLTRKKQMLQNTIQIMKKVPRPIYIK